MSETPSIKIQIEDRCDLSFMREITLQLQSKNIFNADVDKIVLAHLIEIEMMFSSSFREAKIIWLEPKKLKNLYQHFGENRLRCIPSREAVNV